jgi:hypothetical protein
MTRFLESALSKQMATRLADESGSAVVDFVLTAIPVFAALQFLLGFLGLYGTFFAAARATVLDSRQLALADRDNRGGLGFATACIDGIVDASGQRTCWHSKLEPTT